MKTAHVFYLPLEDIISTFWALKRWRYFKFIFASLNKTFDLVLQFLSNKVGQNITRHARRISLTNCVFANFKCSFCFCENNKGSICYWHTDVLFNCKFALGGRKETQSQQGITICLHSLHFPGSTETEKSRPLFFVLMFAVVFVSTYFSWSSESKHFTEHKQYSLETKLFNERSNWLMSVTKWNQREMVAFMGYLA